MAKKNFTYHVEESAVVIMSKAAKREKLSLNQFVERLFTSTKLERQKKKIQKSLQE